MVQSPLDMEACPYHTGFLCALPPLLAAELGKEVYSTATDGLTPQGQIPLTGGVVLIEVR